MLSFQYLQNILFVHTMQFSSYTFLLFASAILLCFILLFIYDDYLDHSFIAAAGATAANAPVAATMNRIAQAGGQWPPAKDGAPELKRRWTKLAPNGLGMEDISVPVA